MLLATLTDCWVALRAPKATVSLKAVPRVVLPSPYELEKERVVLVAVREAEVL